MTKVKIEGEKPLHCYFWMATLTDGKVIPEYDFENSKYNHTRDLPIDFVTRFSFYPVNHVMKGRVKESFNDDLIVPVDNRIHYIDINLEKGERLRIHPVWRNDIAFMGNSRPTVKYCLFKVLSNGESEGFFVDEFGTVIKG